MQEFVQQKATLDSFDYQILHKKTQYLFLMGLGVLALSFVAGFVIGFLRSPKQMLKDGLLGGTIFIGIFMVLWAIVIFLHLLTYLSRKTTLTGIITQKSIAKAPKSNDRYFLHFENHKYNVPRSFYNQVQEGKQVRLHFSNMLFLFIRGEVIE